MQHRAADMRAYRVKTPVSPKKGLTSPLYVKIRSPVRTQKRRGGISGLRAYVKDAAAEHYFRHILLESAGLRFAVSASGPQESPFLPLPRVFYFSEAIRRAAVKRKKSGL